MVRMHRGVLKIQTGVPITCTSVIHSDNQSAWTQADVCTD